MAELFSTDFLERAETAAGRIPDHSDAHFSEVQAALSERADEVC
jgi:hypothetical protein